MTENYIPQEVIRKKRDGFDLIQEEIEFFIKGLTSGEVMESQAAAFAMCVYMKGMKPEEISWLTTAMKNSGKQLKWNLNGPVIDKHSTGGVGDKVSLILAPLAAACGCYVPMISGRGLGHTGGTLDKLACVPGYNVAPDIDLFRKTVKQIGCAVIGQTADMAPADKILYSVRDVTATVESIPLITASILSKKFSAGLDYLVMDVKTGNGAFMSDYGKSEELARSINSVCKMEGAKSSALITDMNSVLGLTAGHFTELRETLDFLGGTFRDPRLYDVTVSLTAEMVYLCGLCADLGSARNMVEEKLQNGAAMEIFSKMISALGGPADFAENHQNYMEQAPVIQPVLSPEDGYLASTDTRRIGLSLISLGGGRKKSTDKINPGVGISHVKPTGSATTTGEPIAVIHAEDDASANYAAEEYLNACIFSMKKPESTPTIYKTHRA